MKNNHFLRGLLHKRKRAERRVDKSLAELNRIVAGKTKELARV